MAKTTPPVTSIDEAIKAFVDGARLHHAGAFLRHNQLAIDGILRSDEGLHFIDTQVAARRDVLLPLLDHEDDVVRITAASALIPSHLDRAIAAIRHVHENSVSEAFGSAVMIMSVRDTFGDFKMGLCAFDPRYPDPGQRPPSLVGPPFDPRPLPQLRRKPSATRPPPATTAGSDAPRSHPSDMSGNRQ